MSAKISKALSDAIADPFVMGDARPEWTLPSTLPPIAVVRTDIATLRADVVPAPVKDAKWCLDKMRQRFGVGSTEVDKAAWLQALGTFPRDLLFEAVKAAVLDDKRPTLEGFTRHPGLVRRQTDLARAEAILAKLMAPKPVAAFKPEPVEVRLRQLLEHALRRHDTAKAADWERQLAKVEGREPEGWAAEAGIPVSASVAVEKPPEIRPTARNAALLLRARARWWRKNRLDAHADRLEREADALAPEHVEEPLGEDYEQGAAA